jgi:uncharacterized MAPEG superfamily protein
LFAAAVTAGNVAGLSLETLNYLSLGYIASRIMYTWVYIFGQDNPHFAAVRTVVWSAGTGFVCTFFVKAGQNSQP